MTNDILKRIAHIRKELDALEKLVLEEAEPAPPATDPKAEELKATAAQVIRMFNEMCGTSYGEKADKNIKPVMARLNDGRTLEDFKLVISDRKNEWANDKKMCNYLRPETVFSPKFEGYLNSARLKRRRTVSSFTDEIEMQDILRRQML